MIDVKDKFRCSGCQACASICPKQCIRMVADEEGFLYPQIDKDACINCRLCENVCPILNAITPKNDKLPLAYALKNKDEQIRETSSSGGAFTALAQYVIKQGGIVFGVAFDEKLKVSHIGVEKQEDIEALRRSKYVQSNIKNTYIEAKDALNEGRLVLFTGTPCQIGGLKAFLKKEYENLYTQDCFCHGVPSPMVWEKYLQYVKNKYKREVKRVIFRDKAKSWRDWAITLQFEDGSSLTQTVADNLYAQAFLKDFCLRPSCYQCQFKGVNRIADITLADFWGVQHLLPEMDDNKGTSLVLVHTEKGKKLFDKVAESFIYKETETDKAIEHNLCAVSSVKMPEKRAQFMDGVVKEPFNKTKKYYDVSLRKKMKRVLAKIKNIILRR